MLWADGYQDISTIGPLFLVQGIGVHRPRGGHRGVALAGAAGGRRGDRRRDRGRAAAQRARRAVRFHREPVGPVRDAFPAVEFTAAAVLLIAACCSRWRRRRSAGPAVPLAARNSSSQCTTGRDVADNGHHGNSRRAASPMRCCSPDWARATPSWRWRSCAASSGSSSAWRWPCTGDPATAEDVAQQAFEQAWRHASVYDSRRGSVRTWLTTITHNLAIDVVRARVGAADGPR